MMADESGIGPESLLAGCLDGNRRGLCLSGRSWLAQSRFPAGLVVSCALQWPIILGQASRLSTRFLRHDASASKQQPRNEAVTELQGGKTSANPMASGNHVATRHVLIVSHFGRKTGRSRYR